MKSTIFFRNFTCMDHAYIDDNGMIHGGSLLLSCNMTGTPTKDESVVLDFSKGKSQLKKIVDDRLTGLDHKLLLFKESKYEIERYVEKVKKKKINRVKITTPLFEADLPEDAIQEVENYGAIGILINQKMKELYPDFDLECKIEISSKGYTNLNAKYFNYSHGLKKSSSIGCQNPCHGHFSFVEVLATVNGVDVYDNGTAEEIADYMNNGIFVFSENVKSQTLGSITVEYTCDRGLVSVNYKQPHKIIVLRTETTIEYIIQFIADTFKHKLKGKTLRISEGLQKGAEINVEI